LNLVDIVIFEEDDILLEVEDIEGLGSKDDRLPAGGVVC
jgi:hypothetical protein